MEKSAFKNTVLQHLKPNSIKRLQLRAITLERGHSIESPGKEIKYLYFIEDGLGSMTTTFKDGFQVEVGLLGNEAVIGTSALIGTKRSLNHVYMQVPGNGYVCTTGKRRLKWSHSHADRRNRNRPTGTRMPSRVAE
jgi:hypothetical protein